MGKVDLHTHSTFSDGTLEPRMLFELAQNEGIKVFSITDHDEINGSKELMKYNDKGIYLYSGVELTAQVDKGRMHILGYNIDLDDANLNKRLKEMKEDSLYNIMLYVSVLKNDFGILLPEKEVYELFEKDGNVGRPAIALLMIKHGYCKNVDEAFDNYLVQVYEKVRKLKKGLSKEECVDLILKAGGVVSLAHPCSLKLDNQELEREVVYLKRLGMQSIEVIHINNRPEQREFYHELACKYDLLESGGTDFHGYEVKPDVFIGTGRNGNVNINEETLSLTKNIKSRYMRR